LTLSSLSRDSRNLNEGMKAGRRRLELCQSQAC